VKPLATSAGGFAFLSDGTLCKLAQAFRMPRVASMVKPSPEELVKAFRKAAQELGCNKSEQRFQEALFAIGTQKIGTHKPARPFSKRGSKTAQRPITPLTKSASD
jgi:hypothetical protein